AEDGIRDFHVTGVQTCALPILVMRVLEKGGLSLVGKVAYVAGHSLGEYSALAAAGTFSLADTARLLRIRGNAMQAAVPVGEGARSEERRVGKSGEIGGRAIGEE